MDEDYVEVVEQFQEEILKQGKQIKDYRTEIQRVIDDIDVVSKESIKTLLKYTLEVTPHRY